MKLNEHVLSRLDTSRLKQPKKFKRNGEMQEIPHLGVLSEDCEVVGHTFDYLAEDLRTEVSLFGCPTKKEAYPAKLICVLIVEDFAGRKRFVKVNGLSVMLPDGCSKEDATKTAKTKIVNAARKTFPLGEPQPVKFDVWQDNFVEPFFNIEEWRRRNPNAGKK